MKKLYFFVVFTVVGFISFGQVGTWTWMNGGNSYNSGGHYGTKGVFDTLNTPKSLYEACSWTDLQGNFWLFGGVRNSNNVQSDLWEFNPTINKWAWINGPGVANSAGIYGTQGIASPNNYPGSRGWGCMTWVDSSGNLWLFGGRGCDINSDNGWLSDLWMYNISTNMWTWMNGPNTISQPGIYGTKGVASSSNYPPCRNECNATWTENNNLWMYGGEGISYVYYDDLWMYDISTNEWTWEKGDNTTNHVPIYGIEGVADTNNNPGSRTCYSKWKSNNGNLWLFGGANSSGAYNDLWKFDIPSNSWTWISGTNVLNDAGSANGECTPSTNNSPHSRFENRACWTAACGNFEMYGGWDGSVNAYNDLWNYSSIFNSWTLMNGPININNTPVFGTKHLSSTLNTPGGIAGSVSWIDNTGKLWLFGGSADNGLLNVNNTMWRFIVDPCCPVLCGGQLVVTSSFTASPLSGCEPLSVPFSNNSINGNTFLWDFGDGDTSTSYSPIHVYTDTGTYSVSLIAYSNCGGIPDTSIQISYITVFNSIIPTITPNGDTTFCQGDSVILDAGIFTSYHWSNGATTETITIATAGNYSVTVSNLNGCTAVSSSITITVNPLPTPAIIVIGNNSFCIGDSAYLHANSGYTSYIWSTGNTTESIFITMEGTYNVTVTDTNGCINSTSNTDNYHLLPPIITANGDTGFCLGDSVLLDAGTFVNYNWNTGATTETITATTAGQYFVTVSTLNGCSATTAPITITTGIPFIPIIIPIGDTNLCNNPVMTLEANIAGYDLNFNGYNQYADFGGWFNYQSFAITMWVNPSSTQVAYTDLIDNYHTSVYSWTCEQNNTVTNQYIFSVIGAGGITFQLTANTWQHLALVKSGNLGYVYINGVSNGFYNFTNSVNYNGSQVLDLAHWVSGGRQWNGKVDELHIYNAGLSQVEVQSDMAHIIQPNIVGDYNMNEGSGSVINDISGNNHNGVLNNVVFQVSDAPVDLIYSYVWTPLNQITSSITVTTPNTYTVTITDVNGCKGTATQVITGVLPILSLSGPTTFCDGDSIIISAGTFATYQWSNGSTAESVIINNSGNYEVTVSNGNGCTGTAMQTVTVNPTPIPIIIPSGDTVFCEGNTLTLFTNNYVSYDWNTGSTDQFINVTNTGNYILTVTDINGCVGIASQNIIVNPSYSQIIDTTICQGDIYVFPDRTTSNKDTVQTSSFSTINSCDSSITTFLNVIGVDTSVFVNGLILTSQAVLVTYQWIDCGNGNSLISGAMNQSYTVTTNGSYAVIVTQNGCSDTSACIDINNVGIEGIINSNQSITIYPNPNDGSFTLLLNQLLYLHSLLVIKDIIGRIVYTQALDGLSGKERINVSDLSDGVYLWEVDSDKGIQGKGKMVIIKD